MHPTRHIRYDDLTPQPSPRDREGISLNKAVTQLLALAPNPTKRNTDFDEFSGSWSPEATTQFNNALALTLEHGCILIAHDAHFRDLPLLPVRP